MRDQGKCGSCWAFSSVAAVEGQIYNATRVLKKFSVQQLVDCDTQNNGCDGGNPVCKLNNNEKLRNKLNY